MPVSIRPLTIALAAALIAPALPAPADGGIAGRTNRERAARGLPPLVASGDLSAAAARAAAAMARDAGVRHNRWRAAMRLGQWRFVRENVGIGASESRVWSGFMHSMGHRANLLHGDATHIGVGAVRSDGAVYVSVLLASPRRETPPAPRPVVQRRPRPTSSPPPEPEPQPQPPIVTVCMLVSLISLEQPAGSLPLPRDCLTPPLP